MPWIEIIISIFTVINFFHFVLLFRRIKEVEQTFPGAVTSADLLLNAGAIFISVISLLIFVISIFVGPPIHEMFM